MARKSIDSNTLRFLYGKSGNKCAFPDCCEPIFESDATLTGECCHIEAYSANGPRFNPKTTIEQKNAEENLILLCSRHHKIIDAHPQEYTAERLREMKQTHEQQYSRETRVLNNSMVLALQQSMSNYWQELQQIDKLANCELKIEIDTDEDVLTLMHNAESHFYCLESCLEFVEDSDYKILEDLKSLCDRIGVEYSQFDNIPYNENPLHNRNWEIYSLAFPNFIRHIKLYYLQLCVKVLENLALQDGAYNESLEKYKNRLKEHHTHNYYSD